MRTFAGLLVLAAACGVQLASAFVVTTTRPPLTSMRRSSTATRPETGSVLSLRSSIEGGDRASPSRREALGLMAGTLLLPTAAFGQESYMYTPAPLNGQSKTVVITVSCKTQDPILGP